MSKATEMARVSAKGGFHLLWGLVASTLISAIATIVIARLLGPANYGLYAIALTAPNLISTFRDWGVNTAMVKYSAQHNSEQNVAKIKSVFVSGLLFEVILGMSLSILSFLLSGFLADTLGRPTIAPLIQIASFFILTGALVNVASAAFTGMETMHLNSVMLIVQSVVKTVLIVGFVVLGFGTLGAITGFTLSGLVAGVTGVLLMWTMYRSLPKTTKGKLDFVATTKTMFKYGLPLSVGTIVSGFATQFYSYVLAIYVTNNASIGNYNAALNFVVLITFFATPVTTMLFPAFSKLDFHKDKATLQNVFQYSVKYSALIVVPVTAMVMALAQPAISTLFQDEYAEVPLFLVLLSLSYLYAVFGNLSVGSLINGQGYTKYNLKLSILTVALGIPVSFVLISNFGVAGLIVATISVGVPSLFLSLRFIKKQFGLSIELVSSAKILFSSAISGVLTYLFVSELAFSSLVRLLIGVVVFGVLIVASAVATQTISRVDVNNMREIVNALGPLRKPLHLLLSIIEKLMTLLNV